MQTDEDRKPGFGSWVREGLQVPSAALTFGMGALSLALTVLGPLAVVTANGLTPSERLTEGFLSSATSTALLAGGALGAVAMLLGFGRYRRMPTKRSREQAIAGAVLGVQAVAVALVLTWIQGGRPDRLAFHFLNFEVVIESGYGVGAFLWAAKNTLTLALVGELGGIVLGLLLAMLVISKRRVVRAPARVYINFFRGTPLIWQLGAGFFLFRFGFGMRDISSFSIAMIVFAVNTGAYAAEVFRAGLQSIERGQMEAARSLGMSYFQAMRYAIVPQAFRRVIPPLMNEFVILIKDTALVIVMGLAEREYEIYTLAREAYASTFNATFFVAAAVGYLIVTLPLIKLVNVVERRLRSGLVSVA